MARLSIAVWLVAFSVTSSAWSQEPAKAPSVKKSSIEIAGDIDRMIEAKWAATAGVQPAPMSDDADFLRRISLDLIGRVPRVAEVRSFLDDTSPDKRAKMIEQLLASSGYVANMGGYWSDALIPANNNNIFQFQNPAFKSWIEQKVRDEVPYDKIVHEILAGSTGQVQQFGGGGIRVMGNGQGSIGAQTFYAATENKPENIASSASRLFLGVRLECAQCHDHPFSNWSRKQFWETAAFFTSLQVGPPRVLNGKQLPPVISKSREIKIPNTTQTVSAKFMDGKVPDWKDGGEPRKVLADWVVAKENPYFARMAVNRLWSHFFGLGLMEPFDDEPTDENPVSHQDLLDELTKQFIASDFDVKHLIRAFVSSKAYQRSSVLTHPSQAEARKWGRMPVRGLSGEQLYDSLVISVGLKANASQRNQQFGAAGSRFDFLNKFAGTDKRTEKQTSILQALMMMNGKFIADATSLTSSSTLAAVIDAPFMSNGQKIETLYLATLSRMPRPDELERLESYIARGGARNDSAAAFADVFWALLNSSEFALNR